MAGECLNDDSTFINRLIKYDDESAYWCLMMWNTRTNRWAGPHAEKTINILRNYYFKEKIEMICKKYMDSGYSKNPIDSQLIIKYANLAAFYGFKNINNYDIFTIITLHPNNISYENIAILGDERAIPFIKNKYINFRKHKLSKANREVLITYLNCLYHLPQPSAKEVAQDILNTEIDSILIYRLKLIYYYEKNCKTNRIRIIQFS